MQSRREILAEKAIVERLLLENRVEFLKNKFVPLLGTEFQLNLPLIDENYLQEHFQEYSSLQRGPDGKGFYYIDPLAIFNFIVSKDPSRTKQNSAWLLSLIIKGQDHFEDLERTAQNLVDFERVKARMPVEQRDILKYKTPHDLYLNIEPYLKQLTQGEVAREYDQKMQKEAKVVYNDAEYKILIPLTQEASCYYGRNTQWCTAATVGTNYFDSYNRRGPLYIILQKATNTRWQFQLESESYMDERDRPVNIRQFVSEHPKIAEYFERQFRENFSYLVKTPGMTFTMNEDRDAIHAYTLLGLGATPICEITIKENGTTDLCNVSRVVADDDIRGLIKMLNDSALIADSIRLLDKGICLGKKTKQFGLITENGTPVMQYDLFYKWTKNKATLKKTQWSGGSAPGTPYSYVQYAFGSDDEVIMLLDVDDSDNGIYGGISISVLGDNQEREFLVDAFAHVTPYLSPEWSIDADNSYFDPFEKMDPDIKKVVLQRRPNLGKIKDTFEVSGDTPFLRKKILRYMSENFNDKIDNTYWMGKHGLCVEEFSSVSDFVEAFKNEDADNAMSYITGAEHFDIDDDGEEDSFRRDMLNSLPPEELRQVGQYLAELNPDVIEDEFSDEDDPYDPDDIDHIMTVIDSGDPGSLDSAFSSAASQGRTFGAEAQMYKAMEEALKRVDYAWFGTKDWKPGTKPSDKTFSTEVYDWDKPAIFVIPVDKLVEEIGTEENNGSHNSVVADFGIEFKFSSPHYGWDDYDEKAAEERFSECVYDEDIVTVRKPNDPNP